MARNGSITGSSFHSLCFSQSLVAPSVYPCCEENHWSKISFELTQRRKSLAAFCLTAVQRPTIADGDRDSWITRRGGEQERCRTELVGAGPGEFVVELKRFLAPVQRVDNYSTQDGPHPLKLVFE